MFCHMIVILTFFESEDYFIKHGYNFDDVSKNGLSRPS